MKSFGFYKFVNKVLTIYIYRKYISYIYIDILYRYDIYRQICIYILCFFRTNISQYVQISRIVFLYFIIYDIIYYQDGVLGIFSVDWVLTVNEICINTIFWTKNDSYGIDTVWMKCFSYLKVFSLFYNKS